MLPENKCKQPRQEFGRQRRGGTGRECAHPSLGKGREAHQIEVVEKVPRLEGSRAAQQWPHQAGKRAERWNDEGARMEPRTGAYRSNPQPRADIQDGGESAL